MERSFREEKHKTEIPDSFQASDGKSICSELFKKKKTGNKWNIRTFQLQAGVLKYWIPENYLKQKKPRKEIDLSGFKYEPIESYSEDLKYVFQIGNSSRCYFLCATSNSALNIWLEKLQLNGLERGFFYKHIVLIDKRVVLISERGSLNLVDRSSTPSYKHETSSKLDMMLSTRNSSFEQRFPFGKMKLRESVHSRWKTYTFFLRERLDSDYNTIPVNGELKNLDPHLAYYKRSFRRKNYFVGVIPLSGSQIRPLRMVDYHHCIVITTASRKDYYLSCSSEKVRDTWFQTIKPFLKSGVDCAITPGLALYAILAKDLEVDKKNILGKGGSAVVYKGILQNTTEVAVKMLNSDPDIIDIEEKRMFFNEIVSMLKMKRHPNVVAMLGYCTNFQGHVCLITEILPHGDLTKLLYQKDRPKLSMSIKFEMASSIAIAMEFIHKEGFIHRDLKPGNVLIKDWEKGTLKVCDFGLVKSAVTANKRLSLWIPPLATPCYAAPELNRVNHDKKVDVFSYGFLLWEIDNECRAWEGYQFNSAIEDAIKNNERPPLIASSIFSPLISRCWDNDPSKRPLFSDIVKDLKTMAKDSIGVDLFSSPSDPPRTTENKIEQNDKMQKTGYMSIQIAYRSFQTEADSSSKSQIPVSINKKLLDLFENKESIESQQFLKSLKSIIVGKNNSELISLYYCLCETQENVVTLKRLKQFFDFFSSIYDAGVDFYKNSGIIWINKLSEQEKANSYLLNHVLDMISPSYFHGFLTYEQENQILQKNPIGSFLLRFSSSSNKKITLSAVSSENKIDRWHITIQKDDLLRPPSFSIGQRNFSTIPALISFYSEVALLSDDIALLLQSGVPREGEDEVHSLLDKIS